MTGSPMHPIAGQGRLKDLKIGDTYDVVKIVNVERLDYTRQKTHDILPSGTSGIYWANGIPLRSTLSPLR